MYGERRSPCLVPLSNETYPVEWPLFITQLSAFRKIYCSNPVNELRDEAKGLGSSKYICVQLNRILFRNRPRIRFHPCYYLQCILVYH